jgi:hypothetical protein
MSEDMQLFSKVLILDKSTEHIEQIKRYFDQNGLIGLRVSYNNLMDIMGANIDLGCIIMAEDYLGTLEETAKLAKQLRTTRPELPIMLRKTSSANMPEKYAKLFCVIYTIEDMVLMSEALKKYIFNMAYPNAFIRGVSEITGNVLSGQFSNVTIFAEPPYIVRDRIIYGELFSLIQLESSWCKGYMMLQAEDNLVRTDHSTAENAEHDAYRHINSVLGETTNLIWGGIKNRFIADDDTGNHSTVQVPIVINHKNKYISFGSENPQLCFKYTMLNDSSEQTIIYQWFVFNLNWSPEYFQEIQVNLDNLIDTGELEY